MKNPAGPSAARQAFEGRAARAEMLAGASAPAEGPLRFAAGLYRAQARMAIALEHAHAERPLCGRLRAWWDGGRTSSEDYLSRALLRPYVEVLARRGIAPDRVHRPGHCPVCGGAPWIAARRAESDGDGARRSLGCALCGGEWSINRIRCPCCAEEDPARLPSFQSDAHPTARLEACETCRRYVKSIDLTVDARALPEVDDLVSIGLDLWAAREGFTRIEPGLAGL